MSDRAIVATLLVVLTVVMAGLVLGWLRFITWLFIDHGEHDFLALLFELLPLLVGAWFLVYYCY